MTNEEYSKFADRFSPRSKLVPDMLRAFVFGGVICCIGQALGQLYQSFGMEKTDSASLVSITLIFLGALLTGLGVYDDLAKRGGAGTLVPITGFANSVVSPALEFKSEGLITGMAAKMFIIAGPVIVYGISASVLYGLLLVLIGAK